MRCKSCNYPLWTIVARACPECGAAFKPSTYDFIPDSVRFCCPHCQQAYYGTDERGLPVPRNFACVGCARQIDLDEMVLLPAEGVEEAQTDTARVAWVDRRESSLAGAYLRTLGMALFTPPRLMAALPAGASVWSALLFCAITQALFGFAMASVLALFVAAVTRALPGPSALVGVVVMLGLGVGAAVFWWVLTILWALSAHALLRLTGRVEGSLSRTVQAFCYASAGNVLTATPCLGLHLSFIAWIWWAVGAILMLRTAHKVSGWRASLATLAGPMLILVISAAGITLLVVNSSRSGAAAPAAVVRSGPAGAKAAVLQATVVAFEVRKGRLPSHPVELVLEQQAFLSDFFLAGQPGSAEEGMLLGFDLRLIDGPASSVQAVGAREAILARMAEQPQLGAAAERLGDFVFCSTPAGAGGAPAGSGLWSVICAPLSAVQAGVTGGAWTVAHVDGSTEVVTPAQQAAALAVQNALRLKVGLAPIPDPTQVQQASQAPDR